jgi:hypothetical protein
MNVEGTMATSRQGDTADLAKSLPPELAEKLRQRRPGYDMVYKLVQEYESFPPNKRDQMAGSEVLDLFVRPMFQALGWSIEADGSGPALKSAFPVRLSELVLSYHDVRVSVEVKRFGDALFPGFADEFFLLVLDAGTPWGILTNFDQIAIWDCRDPKSPSLEWQTSPSSYLADESDGPDLLAAEIFYQRLAQPSGTGSTVTTQTPADLGSYGEPGGPRRRCDVVAAGLGIGGDGTPPHTLTALVTNREGKLRLLLGGSTWPVGTVIFQPAPADGGRRHDRIGAVERQVAGERCMASLARPDGDRSFSSALPDGQTAADSAAPVEGMQVCKFGAGSGYTQSQIARIDADVELTDDYRRRIALRGAIFIAGPDFSQPGDVGALVLAIDTRQAVGVIVGYSGEQSVCLPIQPILDQLEVTLITQAAQLTSGQQVTSQLDATTDLIGGEDRLGFAHYVDAFVRLIEDTQPPLTIGIYGAWGTGKSFLMDKIAKRLNPGADVKQIEQLTLWQKMFRLVKTQTPVVWFEAWDYNASDKLWAGLVERIFLGIENSGLGWYGQLRINLKRNLEREWRSLRARLLPYTLIAIVVVALTAGFILNNQDAWAAAVGGSSALVLLAGLVRQLAGVFFTPASQRIVDLFATPDYTADLGFMGRIKQDLEDFANSLPPGMKVVVFIDDLDRCDPKKAVEVLEAIKLLLDLDRFIVFLALDARIITQAVEEYYGKVLVEAEITGYEYLDKIVQIPFSIPEPPPDDLRQYIGSLIGLDATDIPPLEPPAPPAEKAPLAAQQVQSVAAGPAVPATTVPPPSLSPDEGKGPPAPRKEVEVQVDAAEVVFTRGEQETFLAFYSHLDPNPRRIKRLVNIYRLVRALIDSRRQAQAAGAAPPADLPDNPSYTLGWLILCEQWPFAAHVMLEELDRGVDSTGKPFQVGSALADLHAAAQARIAQEGNKALQKLDLKYDRLQSFILTYLSDFTVADLKRLRPYTVNFNPALSAEVQLTLARGNP